MTACVSEVKDSKTVISLYLQDKNSRKTLVVRGHVISFSVHYKCNVTASNVNYVCTYILVIIYTFSLAVTPTLGACEPPIHQSFVLFI